MKTILLSNGKSCLLDDEYHEVLKNFKWDYTRTKNCEYALRRSDNKTLYMHRVIMEMKIGRSLTSKDEVDHIDGNGLNNQLSNLRIATRSSNMSNMRHHQKSRSQYKGVHYRPKYKKPWQAKLMHMNKNIYLGFFDTEKEAAIQYDIGAVFFFEKFAKLNFPERRSEYVEKIKSGYDPVYKRSSKKAKYPGVYFRNGRWIAMPKGKYIGSFDSEEEANDAINSL